MNDILYLKHECHRRNLVLMLLLKIGRVVHEVFGRCAYVISNWKSSECSGMPDSRLIHLLVDERLGDFFRMERAAVLYYMSWFCLKNRSDHTPNRLPIFIKLQLVWSYATKCGIRPTTLMILRYIDPGQWLPKRQSLQKLAVKHPKISSTLANVKFLTGRLSILLKIADHLFYVFRMIRHLNHLELSDDMESEIEEFSEDCKEFGVQEILMDDFKFPSVTKSAEDYRLEWGELEKLELKTKEEFFAELGKEEFSDDSTELGSEEFSEDSMELGSEVMKKLPISVLKS